MGNKIFMLYGAHDIKVVYGLENFKNCIKQFKKIVRRNGLKYEDIISIIENSIDSNNICVDPETSPEDYVKKKTELEKLGLQKFLAIKESFFSTIIDMLKGKSQGYDDFTFQLMKYLKKKKVMMVFEENNYDVVKKEIEYKNKSKEEIIKRILNSSHEVDNLRDNLMVTQIMHLAQKYPDKNFVIVRGGYHNKLSEYLRQARFNVLDYKY